MRKMHSAKPFEYPVCNVSFATQQKLNIHSKIHVEQKDKKRMSSIGIIIAIDDILNCCVFFSLQQPVFSCVIFATAILRRRTVFRFICVSINRLSPCNAKYAKSRSIDAIAWSDT